jgi:hypothetical protein
LPDLKDVPDKAILPRSFQEAANEEITISLGSGKEPPTDLILSSKRVRFTGRGLRPKAGSRILDAGFWILD